MSPRICWIDIETGGLKPEHPVIQIAAIAVDPQWRELESLERKIAFDAARCDPEALALNSYTPEAWKEALPEWVVVADFAAFLDRHRSVTLVSKRSGRPYQVARIAGHNVAFDLDRLSAMFKRHATFFPVDFRSVLDTRYGAIWYFERQAQQPDDFKLTGLAKYFGLAVDGAHDALVDVRLSIALARRLLAGPFGQVA